MTRTLAFALAALLAVPGLPALAQDATPETATPETATSETATPGTATPAPEATPDPAALAVPDMSIGAEDAPIEVVEYGSFTCPHCRDFHADQYQHLKADWIDTGRVRFTFREVYFDRYGLWASMIARCGGEMRFFGIYDMLYDQQRDWIGDQQPQTIADNLRRLGLSAGLSEAQLDACLKDEGQAQALVAWYEANAQADGIEATPTFLIDGESYSNMGWDEFEAVLEERLAAAE